MLAKGQSKPSIYQYGSTVFFLPKKTHKLQMCIDFYALNVNMRLDNFSLHCIADQLDRLGKAKYFSIINLARAYHQVRIAKCETCKTIFFTSKGLYEHIVMPFGLYNAPVTFQGLTNLIFTDFITGFVTIYLDNILVYFETY